MIAWAIRQYTVRFLRRHGKTASRLVIGTHRHSNPQPQSLLAVRSTRHERPIAILTPTRAIIRAPNTPCPDPLVPPLAFLPKGSSIITSRQIQTPTTSYSQLSISADHCTQIKSRRTTCEKQPTLQHVVHCPLPYNQYRAFSY